MNIRIIPSNNDSSENPVEIVERKGIGHPDTLADMVATQTTNFYSQECLKRFGQIPPHYCDKVVLAGAKAAVTFGQSEMIMPIRAYFFGKATSSIGSNRIDTELIFQNAVQSIFSSVFADAHILEHVRCIVDVHDGYGPDHPDGFYNPDTVEAIQTMLTGLRANDTSAVIAYAGYSPLEKLAIEIENYLNGPEFKHSFPETGTDVKVMAVREDHNVTLIVCVPFIGSLTPDISTYRDKLQVIYGLVNTLACQVCPEYTFTCLLNTKDTGKHVYLTAYGSALDKGDVGAVGRGNRYNGVISPCNEMSVEAANGKNPTHHVGRLYSEVAFRIARDIYLQFGIQNKVNIISHNGDDLRNPAHIFVKCNDAGKDAMSGIPYIVQKHLDNLPDLVRELVYANPLHEHVNKPRQMYLP